MTERNGCLCAGCSATSGFTTIAPTESADRARRAQALAIYDAAQQFLKRGLAEQHRRDVVATSEAQR